MDSWESRAQVSAERFIAWIQDHVCKKYPEHGDLQACPFASQAIEFQNMVLHISAGLEIVNEIKAIGPQPHLHHAILWLDYQGMSPEQMEEWVASHNKNHFGMWVAAHHPDGHSDSPAFKAFPKDDFALVLVQPLDELERAADGLPKTKYYDLCDDEDKIFYANRKECSHAWKQTNAQQTPNEALESRKKGNSH